MGILGALTIGGCAGGQVKLNHPPDVRSNVAVAAAAPAVLIAGPTRLLHANFDRRAGVVFTRVSLQQGGADPDCGTGVAVAWDGESDLDVRAGELICVRAVRRVNLSWHARADGAEIPAGTQQASLR
jgi:hypothetical protein